jgi:hypothetical protein
MFSVLNTIPNICIAKNAGFFRIGGQPTPRRGKKRSDTTVRMYSIFCRDCPCFPLTAS